ncbi:hypothetical protein [Microbacterium rhizomatis]|uniref:AbiEi antitoxin C-terminal domain-containing protein n=1 Tax=Microbacterium rhizomatis TaxID=1631477 RepID=A0A5J5J2E0_9MICO|nr:hypothetical protein [Microbacterium rhizomatis]KAA9110230.1 hypothetical protein F6B43_00540 [Microbacterium rhizomatis]
MSDVMNFSVADVRPCPIPLIRARTIPRPGVLVARGELTSVRYGVYTATSEWRALAPWDRYLARVHAAALTMPGLTFSHESAAVLLGLPIFGEPPDVHVLRDPAASSGSWKGLRIHTASTPRQVMTLGGIQLTSWAETAVDIARTRHCATALAVVDAALRAEPGLSVEHLVAVNASRQSSRGRRRARWALHRGDAAADGALESVSRAAVELLGFPAPELQVLFLVDGQRYYVDHYWRDARIVGEADGRLKYDPPERDAAQAVFDEKRREDGIRRMVNGFARWGWDDVRAPERLRKILLSAGLQPLTPAEPEPLATLRAALSPRQIRETG